MTIHIISTGFWDIFVERKHTTTQHLYATPSVDIIGTTTSGRMALLNACNIFSTNVTGYRRLLRKYRTR